MEYLKTDRALFSRKIHFCPKMGKKCPKWLLNRVFWIFWKIFSFSFYWKLAKMETNILVDISPQIPYLIKVLFLSYGPKYCQPIKLQDSLKYNISRKKWMMKFVFGMQINIKVFYKLMLSFWVCATWQAQTTQNKKFAYLCNISRKAWGGSWFFACK